MRYVPSGAVSPEEQKADYRACLREALVVGGGPGAIGFADTIAGEIATDQALQQCMRQRGYTKTINGRPQ